MSLPHRPFKTIQSHFNDFTWALRNIIIVNVTCVIIIIIYWKLLPPMTFIHYSLLTLVLPSCLQVTWLHITYTVYTTRTNRHVSLSRYLLLSSISGFLQSTFCFSVCERVCSLYARNRSPFVMCSLWLNRHTLVCLRPPAAQCRSNAASWTDKSHVFSSLFQVWNRILSYISFFHINHLRVTRLSFHRCDNMIIYLFAGKVQACTSVTTGVRLVQPG